MCITENLPKEKEAGDETITEGRNTKKERRQTNMDNERTRGNAKKCR